MRRLSRIAAISAAALVAVMSPVSAQATAGCGTTENQWWGTFNGTETLQYTYNLEVRIADGHPSYPHHDIYVDVTSSGDDHAPLHEPAITNGRLSWGAQFDFYHPQYGHFTHYDYYTPTNVTCSGGRVTAFSGNLHTRALWNGTEHDGTFTVSR